MIDFKVKIASLMVAISCFYFTFHYYESNRAWELTHHWKNSDYMFQNGDHLVEKFSNFQNIVATSSFVSTIYILDSNKSIIAQYPSTYIEQHRLNNIIYPNSDAITIARIGFFKYRGAFLIDQINHQFLFVIEFSSDKIWFLAFVSIFSVLLLSLFIFDKKRQEQQLKSLYDSTLARFHEVRSPLSLASEICKSLQAQNIPFAKINAHYFTSFYPIINSLMTDMDAIGKNQKLQHPEKIDLSQMVKSYLGCINKDISHLQIKQSFNHQHYIKGDYAKIFSIINNLINNAIKYGEDFIKISTYDDKNKLILKISNLGPTIPKHRQNKIFQPLYRAQQSGLGSGMGLYIARQFALLHNAQISVHSENRRTEFTVKFDKGTKISSQIDSQQNRNYIKIAAIDDETFNDGIIRDKLKKLAVPNRIEFFSQLDDFYTKIRKSNFDVIIIDRFLQNCDATNIDFKNELTTIYGFQGITCLHSNSSFTDQVPTGFDYIIAKSASMSPMLLYLEQKYANLINQSIPQSRSNLESN